MKIRRKTKSWVNPKTGKQEYVVKLEKYPMGEVDLAAIVATKSFSMAVFEQSQMEKYTRELVALLLSGYTVRVPGLGKVTARLHCKQVGYADSKKLGVDSIDKISFKLLPNKELSAKMETTLKELELC